ncbi:hypothetical protein B0H16DRAFT_1703302 [Mycena metata]|uniref:Uncharacterized protein n=1 Tax=Mycena metata TaxID=1033252 RepID=A0AAD7H5C3_9AGAR|nr:hypothetical protein B0H16DRAFT_1703302 [Mycena metata]
MPPHRSCGIHRQMLAHHAGTTPPPPDSLGASRRPITAVLPSAGYKFLIYPIVVLMGLYIWCILNIGVLVAWLYRCASEPKWDQLARIEAVDSIWGSSRPHGSGEWAHFEAVPVSGGGQLLLATFSDSNDVPRVKWYTTGGTDAGAERRSQNLRFGRLPLSSPQQESLLAALDLRDEVNSLNIMVRNPGDLKIQGALRIPADLRAWSLGPLLNFIGRHLSLHTLTIEPSTLHPASLFVTPVRRMIHISSLTAAVEYIPHLLPAISCCEEFTIIFPADARPNAYAQALAAIDDIHPIRTLTLSFRARRRAAPPAHAFPWYAKPDTYPEAHLGSITCLGLPECRIVNVEMLRWMARFPGLASVRLREPVGMISLKDLVQLVQDGLMQDASDRYPFDFSY